MINLVLYEDVISKEEAIESIKLRTKENSEGYAEFLLKGATVFNGRFVTLCDLYRKGWLTDAEFCKMVKAVEE